jgi:hypothetical protein
MLIIYRLLTLFLAFTGKAPALKPYLLLLRRLRQRPISLFSYNARIASSSINTLAAIASNIYSPSYYRSAHYRRVGDLPGKHSYPAITSSRMLFAFYILYN